MKILDMRVMRGPNYWSNYRQKVVVMKLDLQELEDYPSNTIEGFAERLQALMPSLHEHHCSEGHEGGFLERVKAGTWIGHVAEHVALELQTLAGMYCSYGRTRSAETKGVYYVIVSYEVERAGVYAAKAALRIVEALAAGEPYDLQKDIDALKRIRDRDGLGPSTASIVSEAAARGIPYHRLDKGSFVLLGQGKNQKKIRATMTCSTSGMGIDLAGDKEETKNILAKGYIPVAKDALASDEEDLEYAIGVVGFPLVIKPINGNHGRGVTTNIQTKEAALAAFNIAKEISKTVIVERFVQGYDYRFLVVNYKLVAVARRTPAMVIGDGYSTIEKLIEQTNKDPDRGEGHEKILTTIKVDQITENILAQKNLTLQSVLPIGEILFLKDTANLSTGGTSRDVTDLVHPYNVLMAERIARMMNLDICGIDVVARDINVPITAEVGAVLEVNACPGFRMHLAPAKGLGRNVAARVLEMLYPEGSPARIPVVAITGTNGKTTTTRLVAHLAQQAGNKVGYTTTDGIYIQGQLIFAGDCTGSKSAEAVLTDPTIDFAVLECARGGILRSGLGFDHCDISIITNVSKDHLGLGDIHTLEDMARVKAVVARSTFTEGYAILNADDDLVYEMRKELGCRIALFSMDENSERIKRHCARGKWAAIVEKGYITVCNGQWKTRIEKVENIPLCFGGRAEFMTKNVLPAVLAAVLRKFKTEDIRKALLSFIPSPEQTPGRMNIFRFRNCELMVDYAHNPAGFAELKKFMDRTPASRKTGIITGVGDRRAEEITAVGLAAAQTFDEIIIRHDHDLRGRTKEEITELLMEGIRNSGRQPQVLVISEAEEAIRYALAHSPKDAFIVMCTDNVQNSIALARKLQEEEKGKEEAPAARALTRIFLK